MQRRIKLSRPVISTHITQLVERCVLERHVDGSVGLTDREPIALIIQTAREFSDAAHTQAAKDERAAHYLAERRLGKARRELTPHMADLATPLARLTEEDAKHEACRREAIEEARRAQDDEGLAASWSTKGPSGEPPPRCQPA